MAYYKYCFGDYTVVHTKSYLDKNKNSEEFLANQLPSSVVSLNHSNTMTNIQNYIISCYRSKPFCYLVPGVY